MSDPSVDRILASPTGRRAIEAARAEWDAAGRLGKDYDDALKSAHRAFLAVLTSADEKCPTCGGTGDDSEVVCADQNAVMPIPGGCPTCKGTGSNPDKLYTAEQVAREREDARAEAVAAFVERLPERAGDFRVRDWARGRRERER